MNTTHLPVVRASSMKIACLCPASIAPREGEILIDSYDPTATDGSDIHRALALALQGKDYPAFTGEKAAENEGIVELGIAWFNNWLRKEFWSFKWSFEVPLTNGRVSGTLDTAGVHVDREEGAVVDWKATWRDDDHTAQLMAYALLLLEAYPEMKDVAIIVPLLRLGRALPPKIVSRDYVKAWFEEFTRNTLNHPEIYRPGEHCSRCRRKVGCKALVEIQRQSAEVFSDRGFEKMLTRDTLPQLLMRWKLIEQAGIILKAYAKTEVTENGPIKLENGKLLKLVDRNTDVIKIRQAWPLLQSRFSDEEMEAFVTVGKTKLLAAVGEAAVKGQKGKAQDAMMEQLKAAGAVESKAGKALMEVNP